MWLAALILITALIAAVLPVLLNKFKQGKSQYQHRDESQVPLSVNYHLTRKCNYECKFCFHQAKTSYHLPIEEAKRGIRMLVDAGMKKINFSGEKALPSMLLTVSKSSNSSYPHLKPFVIIITERKTVSLLILLIRWGTVHC